MKKYITLSILLTITAFAVAENIDPYEDGSQYAYGESVGWINFGIADNYVVACKVILTIN